MVVCMYFFGIDVAKKQHEACVIDDQGTTVLAMPVPNTQPGAARFLAAVRKRVATTPMPLLLPRSYRTLLAAALLLPD